MSLLWPDARIAILADRVAVTVGREVTDLPVPGGQPDGLTRTLAEAIDAARCKGRVDVVLSHALAPVWLLPPPELRLDWTETRGWAREQLRAQLGEQAGQCGLAFQPAPPGEPLLVSSLDEQWLAGLLTVLASKGLKPRSIQPWLAASANRWRQKLRHGMNWLVLAEPGRLTLALFDAGHPRVVRSLQVGGDMVATLAAAIKREALLAGLSGDVPVWLEPWAVKADWHGGAGRPGIRLLDAGKGTDTSRSGGS